MAGNNSIQFVRGTSSKRASHTETSLAGQPIYETDTNRLYVGDGETSVNDLTAVEASAADIAENVKDQNNGAGIKIWIGTQAEFEDLETDEDTIYYITDIASLLELDEALTTLKEQLTSGAFKVGNAGVADNVKLQINGKNIADIFERDGVTVKEASKLATPRALPVNLALSSGNASKFDGSADTSLGVTGTLPVANGGTGQSNLDNVTVGNAKSATSATDANNVKSTINGKAITSIFERDGTTVKKATSVAKYLHNIEYSPGPTEGYYSLRFQLISNDSTAYGRVSEVAQVLLDEYNGETIATGYAETLNAPIKYGFPVDVKARINKELDVVYYFADGTSRDISVRSADTVRDVVVEL